MQEKCYKKMKTIGGGNIALGIIVMITGLVCGIMAIVNGARLLHEKSDRLF